jgi:predicted DsbA family dithiol-disulfide isomerase
MKIEIWSDVVCPWCYIGKRRLEAALEEFQHRKKVKIVWKSYQLDPEMETDPNLSIYDYLSERKGIPYDEAESMGHGVSAVAHEMGLNYNLDNTIPVNTLQAHEVLHFAKEYNLQTATKERLLKAYFVEGENLDDRPTLLKLAQELGLDSQKLVVALEKNSYASAVQEDIKLGREFGLRGVPFFVFNRKFGISGAQTKEEFLKTLNESFSDWEKDQPKVELKLTEGKVCKPDGTCD